MLSVQIDLEADHMTFECPECGAEDVIHIRQNKECYYCSTEYDFDITLLILNESYRKKYHLGDLY